MGLADRGGASGLVGGRWADLCADWAANLVGRDTSIPVAGIQPFPIVKVARLDDLPRIAAVASKRGLQNPDIVIVGERNSNSVLQAADAKFSVETARSKQVSCEVMEALLALGPLVLSLTGELTPEIEYVPGVFLSPDYPLTHLMLAGRPGITRATVKPEEVIFVPVDPSHFFEPLSGYRVMHVLSDVDDLPVSISESLLAGLYYFRLTRAAVGSWQDSVKPLLAMNDKVDVDEDRILDEACRRAVNARSAFKLILDWDIDVESIRARRAAVEQVASLPVMTKDLRNAVATTTKGKVEEGPSVNQVRRRLASWFRGELRAAVGPMMPDEGDFEVRLQEVGRVGAEIARQIPDRTTAVIQQLMLEKAETVDVTPEAIASLD